MFTFKNSNKKYFNNLIFGTKENLNPNDFILHKNFNQNFVKKDNYLLEKKIILFSKKENLKKINKKLICEFCSDFYKNCTKCTP